MLYWLKTLADITGSGTYAYDSSCFLLDNYAVNLDLGTPTRKYVVKEIIGNGSSITGGDTFGIRTIVFTRRFKSDGTGYGALTSGRVDFLTKFILSSDDIYLIRNYGGVYQKIKVYPVITSSEKHSTLLTTDPIEITLRCDVPFFEAITQTSVGPFTKNTRYYEYAITNPGAPTPLEVSFVFAAADIEVRIAFFDNTSIGIIHDFEVGDELVIDTGTFRVWLNDIERFNLDIYGSPFNMLPGGNTFRMYCESNLTSCYLKYTGRYI